MLTILLFFLYNIPPLSDKITEFTGPTGYLDSKPRGCYVAKNSGGLQVDFNEHPTGKRNEFAQQICIKG